MQKTLILNFLSLCYIYIGTINKILSVLVSFICPNAGKIHITKNFYLKKKPVFEINDVEKSQTYRKGLEKYLLDVNALYPYTKRKNNINLTTKCL